MTTIVALRHGETDWNHEGRMQGWAPVPLNERGREQARAAGAWLDTEYEFDAVYASDLLRTRETTECVLDRLSSEHDPTYEPAWRERDIGVYQGLSYGDVAERFPAYGLGESGAESGHRTPESGESLASVSERASARFDQLRAEHGPDETVLVVAHGGPIYLLTGHVKGLDIREAVLDHSQDNCGATVFECGETVEVVAENRTGWDG